MYDHHQAYLMTILFEVHVKVKFNLFVGRTAERILQYGTLHVLQLLWQCVLQHLALENSLHVREY